MSCHKNILRTKMLKSNSNQCSWAKVLPHFFRTKMLKANLVLATVDVTPFRCFGSPWRQKVVWATESLQCRKTFFNKTLAITERHPKIFSKRKATYKLHVLGPKKHRLSKRLTHIELQTNSICPWGKPTSEKRLMSLLQILIFPLTWVALVAKEISF